MAEPVVPIQTLDLRGEKPVLLHRPGLAAAACWFIVAGDFIQLCLLAFEYRALLVKNTIDVFTALRVDTISILAAVIMLAIGWLLLAIANLARGIANPWPFRILIAGGLVEAVVSCFRHSLIWFSYDPAAFRGGISLLTWTFDFEAGLAAALLNTVILSAGLIYALQLARLVRSRFLAYASIALFTCALLDGCAGAAYFGLCLAFLHHHFTYPAAINNLGNAVSAFAALVIPCSICYFAIIALRLAGARRRVAV